MHFWPLQNEIWKKHMLYRCKRLALMHNSDYITKYGNEAKEFARGASTECDKRLTLEIEKRMRAAFPVTIGLHKKRLSHG